MAAATRRLNKEYADLQKDFPPNVSGVAPDESNLFHVTRIYHPNVTEEGALCIGLLKADAWKPSTKIDQGEAEAGLDSRLRRR
ncbi:hypothetical protein P7C70_g7092, partial [Phenoliferia sp. Uapishka_3]